VRVGHGLLPAHPMLGKDVQLDTPWRSLRHFYR
jgi:hypothetical protein